MRLTEAETELLGKLLRVFHYKQKPEGDSVYIRDSEGTRILFGQIHHIPTENWGDIDGSLSVYFDIDESTTYFLERMEKS